MIHTPETESATLEILQDCWEQAASRKIARRGTNPLREDLYERISHEMLPMVVHLLHERRDCDCSELVCTVKRLVIEHIFYENAVEAEQWQINVDSQVKMILQAMEVAREKLINEGEWSQEPVTPMMFG
jgi:hypothetical protein